MTDSPSSPRPRGEGTLCVPYVGPASSAADALRRCRRFQFYFDEPTPTAALGRAVREHLDANPALAATHSGIPDERLAELTDVVLELDDELLRRHGFWPLSGWEPEPRL